MGKIIRGAEAGDAPLRRVLLVFGFVQRDLADRGEQCLLLGAADEIFPIDEPIGKSLEQVLSWPPSPAR
jgi:hypothetical protein